MGAPQAVSRPLNAGGVGRSKRANFEEEEKSDTHFGFPKAYLGF